MTTWIEISSVVDGMVMVEEIEEMTTWIEISSVVDGMVMVEEIEDLIVGGDGEWID